MITIKCTNLEQAHILCALDKFETCLFRTNVVCKDGQSCIDCMFENINWIITDKKGENDDGVE